MTSDDDMDVVTFLRHQHEQIRQLFDDVASAGAEGREEAFQCLVRLLAVHEVGEEEVVHPRVRLEEGGAHIVSARLEEESEAKQLLADLEKVGVGGEGFDEQLAVVRAAVEAHAEQEEQLEFPLLAAVDDQRVLRGMTTLLKVAEGMAPTHPHPHGPDGMVGNLVVGPAVAVMDRVRDAIADARR
ncbi:MAG TPA: hemerythrin domain-containing protein [Acidimicrobiales bacterium]|nr:hemerythrin domain-containing protein [Acidimicrobiales bacterium]